MSNEVYESLHNIVKKRQKFTSEHLIDGYSGFILIDQRGNPKVALHIENEMRWGEKKFRKLHPDVEMPHVTPHVLRHTFCTNMVNAGMDVKVLQYIMGHADVDVTLNIYTHVGYERAASQMAELIDMKTAMDDKKSSAM